MLELLSETSLKIMNLKEIVTIICFIMLGIIFLTGIWALGSVGSPPITKPQPDPFDKFKNPPK